MVDEEEERRVAADGRLSECPGLPDVIHVKNTPPFSYLSDPNPNSNLEFLSSYRHDTSRYFIIHVPGESRDPHWSGTEPPAGTVGPGSWRQGQKFFLMLQCSLQRSSTSPPCKAGRSNPGRRRACAGLTPLESQAQIKAPIGFPRFLIQPALRQQLPQHCQQHGHIPLISAFSV